MKIECIKAVQKLIIQLLSSFYTKGVKSRFKAVKS